MIRILAFLLALAPGAWAQSSSPGPAAQNYYSSGGQGANDWTPFGPPSCTTANTPCYEAPVSGGGAVSQSNPLPTAISEPTSSTFTTTVDIANFAITQATLFGYKEAGLDLQTVGTGATIAPKYSTDGVVWHSYATNQNPDFWCRRPGDPTPVASITQATQIWCPIFTPYFSWGISGITNATTYAGNYWFRASQVMTKTVYNGVPIGCQNATHLSGGTTVSTNAKVWSSSVRTVCDMVADNSSGTVGFLQLYSVGTTPSCGGATPPVMVIRLPPNMTVPFHVFQYPELFNGGFSSCVVGGAADNDNTNGPAGIYLNVALSS